MPVLKWEGRAEFTEVVSDMINKILESGIGVDLITDERADYGEVKAALLVYEFLRGENGSSLTVQILGKGEDIEVVYAGFGNTRNFHYRIYWSGPDDKFAPVISDCMKDLGFIRVK